MDIKSRRDFQNVYNEIMNGVKSSIRINGYNKQTNYVFESVRNFIDDVFWGNVNGWIEENGEEVKGLIELEEEK